jgi:hypothetical protein
VADDLHRPQPAEAVPVWAPGPSMSKGLPNRKRRVSPDRLRTSRDSVSIGETP